MVAAAWHFHEVKEMGMAPIDPPLRYLRPLALEAESRAAPAVKRLNLAKVLDPTLIVVDTYLSRRGPLAWTRGRLAWMDLASRCSACAHGGEGRRRGR